MTSKRHLQGLSSAQVIESRARYGSNTLTPPAETPWWKEFFNMFADPLIIILMVAGLLSVGISCYEYFGLDQHWQVFFEPIGIFIAILLATGLSFLFEHRANKAFKLLNLVSDDEPVEVIRDGNNTTVPRRDIVVDDVVILNTGCEIPADGDLIEATTLSIDESTLTGEPLCHKTTVEADFDPEATYPSNHVLRGTKVMEGHGIMCVTRVGDATEMGKVMEEAQIDDSVRTPLNEQLDRLAVWITNMSYTVATFIIVGRLVHFFDWALPAWLLLIPTAIFFGLVTKGFKRWSRTICGLVIAAAFILFIGCVLGLFEWLMPGESISQLLAFTLNTLMVAITLVVVSVPEGLPMAVTLSLANSMSRMLKTNNLVRKMHACETMGAATVICTDKTGTLTQNMMQVNEAIFFGDVNDELVNEAIALNSTATLDHSGPRIVPLGNPTEGALLLWLDSRGHDYANTRESVPRSAELPFTTERKFMASVVQSPVTGKATLYVKGAPEIVLALSHDIAGDVSRESINERLLRYQQQAMRTLAFAYATFPDINAARKAMLALGNEPVHLTFIGIMAISDPVRLEVPDAVAECLNAGIDVKIVTGDTPATAKEIGRRIGLWSDDTDSALNIITGPEVAALTDDELQQRAPELKIISRARPGDKKRLVEALQRNGHVVAVTGDGTNDAPALKAAHVGLSMGDGTSVAKEASDITIIDNSFSSIGRAVMWGRSLYKNIQRFLLFQLTVNVAACLLVMCGAFVGNDSPLTVTQMLWVNLIMDTFGAMALSSLPPSRRVMLDKPRNRNASILTRPMAVELAGVGFIFFAITMAFYWIFIHADITSLRQLVDFAPTTVHTMTATEATLLFSVFVWTHFWYLFNARAFATGQSIFSCKMGKGFWTIIIIIVVGQLIITEVAYNFFNVAPMLHTPDWHFNPTGTMDLLTIVLGSSLVIWVREIWCLIKPKRV